MNSDSTANEIIIMCSISSGNGNSSNGIKGKLIGIGIFCRYFWFQIKKKKITIYLSLDFVGIYAEGSKEDCISEEGTLGEIWRKWYWRPLTKANTNSWPSCKSNKDH